MLGDRPPTMEDVQSLRLTTRVLNESMRLYPQPPVLIRRALANDTLGGFKARGCVLGLPPVAGRIMPSQGSRSSIRCSLRLLGCEVAGL